LLLIGPAVLGLLIVGIPAYLYALTPPKIVRTPEDHSSQSGATSGNRATPDLASADERLAHLLPKNE
jgi:hypothetical protein